MRKKWLTLWALIVLGGSMSAQDVFPYKTFQQTLPNGLKTIVIPMANPGLVAYYSVVRTGHRDEYEEGHTGFAHFFEHMMFRGTKNYPASVYDQLMTSMGADANAYTTDDLTCFHVVFAKDDLAKVMELESDRFQNLAYEEPEFKTESGAVLGEFMKSKMDPWSQIEEALYDTAFDKHTYKHTTIGFEKDVRAMPTMYEYSKTFFARYYRPENVVLLICGDVVPENIFKMVETYYSKWQKGYVAPTIQPEPEQQSPRKKNIAYDGKSLPILTIAYKGLAFDPLSKDYIASQILGEIMFGQTSELYSNLVLKEQKIEFISPGFGMNRDPNLNSVFLMVKDAKDIEPVRNAVLATIGQFQTKPLAAERLENLKSNLRYSFLMGLQNADDVAGNLARFIAITGGVEAINQFYQTLQQTTPQDIQQAAQRFFTPNRSTEILLMEK
jgi:zinc protease